MNFGILMVQGLVNSFGVNVMAAFTTGVRIESFALYAMQDFANDLDIYCTKQRS